MDSGMRDSEWLVMDGYDALVTYKAIRSLRMRIQPPDGSVRVSAPFGMPESVIEDFLCRKHDWIVTSQEVVRRRSYRPQRLVTGGRVKLWGTWREVVAEVAPRASAKVVNGQVHVRRPDGDADAELRALGALYRREMGPAVARQLEKWEPIVGRRAAATKLRRMTSQWGNCNIRSGVITFNTRLAEFQPEALEFVVVHELVHLLERGHGPAFKAHMGALLPDWPARRHLLREHP